MIGTVANISDISQADKLLHEQAQYFGADATYVGALKQEVVQQKLETMPNQARWYIAVRRKPIQQMMDGWQKDLALAFEKLKAHIRAILGHSFPIVKNIFIPKGARYKGFMKNDAQIPYLC